MGELEKQSMIDRKKEQFKNLSVAKKCWVVFDILIIVACMFLLINKTIGTFLKPTNTATATTQDVLSEKWSDSAIEETIEYTVGVDASTVGNIEETGIHIQETKGITENDTNIQKIIEEADTYIETVSLKNIDQENAYILSGSESRFISKEELQNFTEWELKMARNEIYARHGRKFKSQELQDYFDNQSWYEGTIEPEDFDDSRILNEIEKANLDVIMLVEDQLIGKEAVVNPVAEEDTVEVNLGNLGITDLSPYLSDKTEILICYGNFLSDFSPIVELPNLKTLDVAHTGLTSIDFLSDMRQLEVLSVGENSISDISVVTNFSNLRSLDFWYTEVSDITGLSKIRTLENVYMSYSKVTTLEPLMNLPDLKILSISGLTIPKSEYDEFVKSHPNCKIYQEGTRFI